MAKNIFTAENLKLVSKLANERAGNRKDLRDDLFQEGCLALINAVESYNTQLGVPFLGYAKIVLSHAMSKAARNINQVLSVSLDEEFDTCPIISIDGDDDYPQRDICDCEHPTPYERYELANTRAAVRKLVKQLPDKECKAVTLLFGFDGLYERSLECIGEELDCSIEGARKACNRGIKRLHTWLSRPEYSLCA